MSHRYSIRWPQGIPEGWIPKADVLRRFGWAGDEDVIGAQQFGFPRALVKRPSPFSTRPGTVMFEEARVREWERRMSELPPLPPDAERRVNGDGSFISVPDLLQAFHWSPADFVAAQPFGFPRMHARTSTAFTGEHHSERAVLRHEVRQWVGIMQKLRPRVLA